MRPTTKTQTFPSGELKFRDIREGDTIAPWGERGQRSVTIERIGHTTAGLNGLVPMVHLIMTGAQISRPADDTFQYRVTRTTLDYELSETQAWAVRALAEHRGGAVVTADIAEALIARGLATTHAESTSSGASMEGGVTLSLTPEGIGEAKRLWEDYDRRHRLVNGTGKRSAAAARALAWIAQETGSIDGCDASRQNTGDADGPAVQSTDVEAWGRLITAALSFAEAQVVMEQALSAGVRIQDLLALQLFRTIDEQIADDDASDR